MRRLAIAVAAFCCVTAVGACARPVAIVVGVSEYADPSIADLEYAASDARAIALTLEVSCGFARADILLLTDAEVTRAGLVAGFAWLRDRVGASDLALVYLAGHGTAIVDREGDEADGDGMDECFLPQDAVLLDSSTYVTDDELGSWIAEAGSGAVSLFLDSCYSGGQSRMAGIASRVGEPVGSVARDVMTSGLGGPLRGVLAACATGQLAYEDPTLGHGVFSHFLLEGLQDESVAGSDDTLTMSELADYVIEEVSKWSVVARGPQTPVLDIPPGTDIPLVPDVSAARRDGPPLVAYFPFDADVNEAIAGTATVNRGAELVPGVLGNAARFDNQPTDLRYVRTTEAYEPLEGPFSVSFWFRSGRVGANAGAFFSSHARYNNYGPEYSAWINADGSLTFRTDDTYGLNHRQDLTTTTYRWDDGAWHHVVVQRQADGRKEIWVDGTLEASERYSIQDLRTAENPFTIGGSAYAGWSFIRSFTGEIDDLRIYSAALDARRIAELLAMGTATSAAFVPDFALQAAIRRSLGLAQDVGLTTHDLLRVRELVVEAESPLDLTGLEGCRDLRRLSLIGGEVRDLSFVRSFPGLIDLEVEGGDIQSLGALEGLGSIELLHLAGHRISDLSVLATIPNLYDVDLSSNLIDDLSPLARLAKMKLLRLRSNMISDPSPLGQMTKLWYLDLGENRIANILPLASLPKLNVLLVDGNRVSDVSALARAPGLEELNLAWNQIVDIAPLAGLEWLGDYTMYAPGERVAVTLDLTGNAIADFAPLLGFAGLGPGDSVGLGWNPAALLSPGDLDELARRLEARGILVLRD